MSANIVKIDIDLDEWVTIAHKLPRHMVMVDVIMVNPTGQTPPIYICEDRYNMDNFDWMVYNEYDCKIVFWKYKDVYNG